MQYEYSWNAFHATHWRVWYPWHGEEFLKSMDCSEATQTAFREICNVGEPDWMFPGSSAGYTLDTLLNRQMGFNIGIVDPLHEARIYSVFQSVKQEQDDTFTHLMYQYYSQQEAFAKNGIDHGLEEDASAADNKKSNVNKSIGEAWNTFKAVLLHRGIDLTELISLSGKRDRLMQTKAAERKHENSCQRSQKRNCSSLSEQIDELGVKMRQRVSIMAVPGTRREIAEVYECLVKNAVFLSRHCIGSLFVTHLSIHGDDVIQKRTLISTLAPHVEELARDRWGTEVVQRIVQDPKTHDEQKKILLHDFQEALDTFGVQSISLFEDPNANFLMRSCLKAVVNGQVPFSFAISIVQGLSANLDSLLRRQKTNFCYTYKVIMWAIECCSTTAQGREMIMPVLDWCISRTEELINHKYGNILLQHVIAYGSEQHKEIIGRAAVNSFRAFLRTPTDETGKSRWFAGNVVRQCIAHMRGQQKDRFSEYLLHLLNVQHVAGEPWRLHWSFFKILCNDKSNIFLARCLYSIANKQQREQMRSCECSIDTLNLEKKLNCGFKSSLFFDSWDAMGFEADSVFVNIRDITQDSNAQHLEHRINSLEYSLEPLFLLAYKLRVPEIHGGKTLKELDLQRNFHMLPFALETEDGVCTHLSPDMELWPGISLWVFFDEFPVERYVEEFLGNSHTTALESRRLVLYQFHVKNIPQFIGKPIGPCENGLNTSYNFGINVWAVHQTTPHIIKFPGAHMMLDKEDTLLVFPIDEKKLMLLINEMKEEAKRHQSDEKRILL